MTRRTSASAFRQIEAEGLLSKRRFQVYRILYNYGPLTAAEVWSYLKDTGAQIDSIRPRMAELERLNVIEERGERECQVTGRNVLLWDVTPHLPAKPQKEKRECCKHCKGRGYVVQKQLDLFPERRRRSA